MFGFSLHIAESGPLLIITDPIYPVGVILVSFFALFLVLPQLVYVLLGKTSLTGGLVRIGVFVGFIFLFGAVMGHSRVTLDAESNRATLEQTFFYRHTVQVVPFSAIDHAQVASSQTSSAVQLIMTDGRVFQLSSFTQQGNQQAAAIAINRFLHSHSEGESSGN